MKKRKRPWRIVPVFPSVPGRCESCKAQGLDETLTFFTDPKPPGSPADMPHTYRCQKHGGGPIGEYAVDEFGDRVTDGEQPSAR